MRAITPAIGVWHPKTQGGHVPMLRSRKYMHFSHS